MLCCAAVLDKQRKGPNPLGLSQTRDKSSAPTSDWLGLARSRNAAAPKPDSSSSKHGDQGFDHGFHEFDGL